MAWTRLQETPAQKGNFVLSGFFRQGKLAHRALADTLVTMLRMGHELRTACFSNIAPDDHGDMLTGYVFTMVLLTQRKLFLAYLGLANKTLVNRHLTELSAEVQRLAPANYVNKEEILVRNENNGVRCVQLPTDPCLMPALIHR